jgi:hypothetical protein
MSGPGTPLKSDPKVGDVVLFKWGGGWILGRVVGSGDELRVPIQRLQYLPKRGRPPVHRRNRTQLYETP